MKMKKMAAVLSAAAIAVSAFSVNVFAADPSPVPKGYGSLTMGDLSGNTYTMYGATLGEDDLKDVQFSATDMSVGRSYDGYWCGFYIEAADKSKGGTATYERAQGWVADTIADTITGLSYSAGSSEDGQFWMGYYSSFLKAGKTEAKKATPIYVYSIKLINGSDVSYNYLAVDCSKISDDFMFTNLCSAANAKHDSETEACPCCGYKKPVTVKAEADTTNKTPAVEVKPAEGEGAAKLETGTTIKIVNETKDDKATEAVKNKLPEAVKTAIEDKDKTVVVLDISLEKDGKKVEVDGSVSVTIDVPEELKDAAKIFVYHVEGDKFTNMNATLKDGKLTFTADGFSPYVISDNEIKDTKEPVDENTEDLKVAETALGDWANEISLPIDKIKALSAGDQIVITYKEADNDTNIALQADYGSAPYDKTFEIFKPAAGSPAAGYEMTTPAGSVTYTLTKEQLADIAKAAGESKKLTIKGKNATVTKVEIVTAKKEEPKPDDTDKGTTIDINKLVSADIEVSDKYDGKDNITIPTVKAGDKIVVAVEKLDDKGAAPKLKFVTKAGSKWDWTELSGEVEAVDGKCTYTVQAADVDKINSNHTICFVGSNAKIAKSGGTTPGGDDKPGTTTKSEATPVIPNIRPVAPEAAPAETDANGNVVTTEAPATTTGDNGGSTNEGDKNQNTGVVLAVIPAVMAAAGVVISKKRK